MYLVPHIYRWCDAPVHPAANLITLNQLCPIRGPVEVFVRSSLGFRCSKVSYLLATCPYFDNHELEIFDAGGPQCHFITSVTTAVRIRTISVS